MKAIVLAGGKGTRLAPYTMVLPKPLLPIGDLPILDIILHQLSQSGFKECTLALGYLSQLFEAYLKDRKQIGEMSIKFITEVSPTGTSGSLRSVPNLTDAFLVMNGDILTSLDFAKLIDFHKKSGASLTIAAHEKINQVNFGVINTDANGFVIDYIEKPQTTCLVSMGIYVYDPYVLTLIKPDQYLDIPDLVKLLINLKKPVATYKSKDLWMDIGNQEDFLTALQVFDQNKEKFLRTPIR